TPAGHADSLRLLAAALRHSGAPRSAGWPAQESPRRLGWTARASRTAGLLSLVRGIGRQDVRLRGRDAGSAWKDRRAAAAGGVHPQRLPRSRARVGFFVPRVFLFRRPIEPSGSESAVSRGIP